jgi:hypothetical protein
MRGNHHRAESRDDTGGQIHERREGNHRPSERPQHDQQGDPIIEVELKGEATDDRQLEEDQPQAAREQQPGEFAARSPPSRQRGARPRQQEKDRRAQVGDPSGEEQRRRRARDVGRTYRDDAEEIACVIKRHQDHDDAAEDVDGLDAVATHHTHTTFADWIYAVSRLLVGSAG